MLFRSRKGRGAEFIRQNTFTHDGTLPLNTSGGQLSAGQAGAAGGFLGRVEGLRQLTGQANGRQVQRRSAKNRQVAGVKSGSHQGLQPGGVPEPAPTKALGDAAQHVGFAQHVDLAQHVLVSGFGMINYDRGLGSGAAILARAE